jgi:hypothetical protein
MRLGGCDDAVVWDADIALAPEWLACTPTATASGESAE